jgi:tetratricopeptide (TPR) repeat protein
MIAEEIAKAKQAKQKSITTGLITIVSVTFLSALMIFAISNFKLVSKQEIDISQSSSILEIITRASEDTIASDEESRQDYLVLFTQYENNLKPLIESIDIVKWDKTLSDKLALQENEALKFFSAGKYSTALKHMEALMKIAENTISASSEAFDHAMEEATSAYLVNDYLLARLSIEEALMHKSSSKEAKFLSNQIERIPEIAKLDEAIQIEKLQNNSLKELELIEQRLAIDKDHTILQQRSKTLRSKLVESRFKNAIILANSAIDRRQVSVAKEALGRAKSIDPSRTDVADVTQALEQLQSQLRFEVHREKGDQASNLDDWLTARQEYKIALAERPADSSLMDKLADAERIVSIGSDIDNLLQNPHRLNNNVVKTRAELTLIKAIGVIDKSPELTLSVNQLKLVMVAVNKPIPVTILSDGQTFVQLRGIGIIGITKSKLIELKPGSYTFEGKRDGYKSKIVEMTIPFNKPSSQLTVIADERI